MIGKTGAKRSSYYEKNPRELLVRLMKQNKTASEEAIQELMFEEVKQDHRYFGAIFAYWFANNWRYAHGDERATESSARTTPGFGVGHNGPPPASPRPQGPPPLTPEQLARRRQEREARTDAVVTVVLLNLTMPNGKQLRKCTKADLIKFGGFYKKLAQFVLPGKTVEGSNLSEARVQEIFG